MSNLVEVARLLVIDLKHDGWRTAITVLNLLVFFCCYFSLSALSQAGDQFGDQPTDASALLIMSKDVLDPSESIITAKEIALAKELIPNYVESVTPLILKVIKMDDYLFQLRAARLEDMQEIHALELLQGKWPAPENEVLIGEGTTHLSGWQIGDTINIYGSAFTISGIVRASGTKFSSVWMPLATAESLFQMRDTYQFAWIQTKPGTDAEQVLNLLRTDSRLRDQFEIYLADNLYQEYTEALSSLSTVSRIMVLLALFAVMLGTYGSIFLILSERNREINILRACGISSRAIRGLIIFRTLIQLFVAYVFGYGITALVLGYLNRINPITLHSIPLPVTITGDIVIVGLILAAFFGLAGVWIPTVHLEKKSVAGLING